MATRQKKAPKPTKRALPGEYVGFRSPKDLKDKLEAAADAAGRSLSTEAQLRLERSFVEQDYFAQLESRLGGKATVDLAIIVAKAMHRTGVSAAGTALSVAGDVHIETWPDIPFAFDHAMKAAVLALEALRPPGDPSPPKQLEQVYLRNGKDLNSSLSALRSAFVTEILRSSIEPAGAPDDEMKRLGREVASRRAAPAKGAKP